LSNIGLLYGEFYGLLGGPLNWWIFMFSWES
jgi:hypothetical protein